MTADATKTAEPSAQMPPQPLERDERGRIGAGNQLARKYPKPALEDPDVSLQAEALIDPADPTPRPP